MRAVRVVQMWTVQGLVSSVAGIARDKETKGSAGVGRGGGRGGGTRVSPETRDRDKTDWMDGSIKKGDP